MLTKEQHMKVTELRKDGDWYRDKAQETQHPANAHYYKGYGDALWDMSYKIINEAEREPITGKRFTVNAVRWQDSNGNTYHTVRATRHSDGAVISSPVTYGYDDAYRQTALELMHDSDWLNARGEPFSELYRYERDNDYPILWTVSDGRKRDMVANGTK